MGFGDKMDEPWKKKKKFGDSFLNFDLDKIENMVDKVMKDMFGEGDLGTRGISMKIDSEGRPKIEEFGNPGPKGGENIGAANTREPLVDIIRDEHEFVVTVELPGAEKKDIGLKCEKGKMAITVNSAERSFFKELELPAEVLPETAKAKFKNGILEVKLKKEKRKAFDKGNVKIE